MSYYAIQIIGYGKHQHFAVKQICENGLVLPVDGTRVCKSAALAQAQAENIGIRIASIGDFYHIINASLSH